MAKKPKVPRSADDKDQSERFIETAQRHQTDETGQELKRAFKAAVPQRGRKQKPK